MAGIVFFGICFSATGVDNPKQYRLSMKFYQVSEAPELSNKAVPKITDDHIEINGQRFMINPRSILPDFRDAQAEHAKNPISRIHPFKAFHMMCNVNETVIADFKNYQTIHYMELDKTAEKHRVKGYVYNLQKMKHPDKLKLKVKLDKTAENEFVLSYVAEIARMEGREALEGVKLDVGPPIVQKMTIDTLVKARFEKWFINSMTLASDMHIVVVGRIWR